MTALQSVVIIGAGQTGAVAARSLRERGYTGTLTLIGDERHLPYERPPLSKDALAAESDDTAGRMHPADFYEQHRIDHMGGTAAVQLDPARQEIRLSNGAVLHYDACLIATGGRARRLSLLPDSLPGVHTLRTLDDAAALRGALRPGRRLAVIGGGFLGLEAAWTAKQRGVEVTVLEGGSALLARVLPPELSQWLLQRARALGIDVLLEAAVASAVPGATAQAGFTLALDDGRHCEADQILVAIGLVPETALARQAGLSLCERTGGILVDAHCRTSAPGVWAAGDCASQCRQSDSTPTRVESWQNANTQGALAAASILGDAAPAVPYPWFWTDQLGCNIQILGAPVAGLRYVTRGLSEPADAAPKLLWLGLENGVPVHGIAINAGGDLRTLRPLFEQRVAVEADVFQDPAVSLKPFVKSSLQRNAAPTAAADAPVPAPAPHAPTL